MDAFLSVATLSSPNRLLFGRVQALHVRPGGILGPSVNFGMHSVHVGVPFVLTVVDELARLGAERAFVVANRSSADAVAPLLETLGPRLAAPLCCDIIMGGMETGLLAACNKALAARADAVISIGGGAVQDAAKLIRVWLAVASVAEVSESDATLDAIQSTCLVDDAAMDHLPPQIACPNSFAMAEMTHVAGVTTNEKKKSGAAHPLLMPTVVVFDPTLAHTLPDWVRFGTALRCVEHAVGAATHPRATEEIRLLAYRGLGMVVRGIGGMLSEPTSPEAMQQVYKGGWMAIRALNTGCYPALGHLVENMYSARFGAHQGSCSGTLCARILSHHHDATREPQAAIASCLREAMGSMVTGAEKEALAERSAAGLVTILVSKLPGVAKDHGDIADVSASGLKEFAEGAPLARLNSLSCKPFSDTESVFDMITRPLHLL